MAVFIYVDQQMLTTTDSCVAWVSFKNTVAVGLLAFLLKCVFDKGSVCNGGKLDSCTQPLMVMVM